MIALGCTDSGIEKSPTAAFFAGYNRSIHRSGGNLGVLPGYQWASSVSANYGLAKFNFTTERIPKFIADMERPGQAGRRVILTMICDPSH
jgi:hypothetical protein